jgi:hypothetical protein
LRGVILSGYPDFKNVKRVVPIYNLI